MRTIADARAKQRQTAERYFAFMSPLLLVVCAGWVCVLAVLNVRDRRSEIGLLRALGHGSARIAGLFLGRALLIGIVAAFVWAFGTMFIFFKIVAATFGLRVSPEEEVAGLDAFEHGNEAYAPDTFSATAAGASA